VTRGRADRVRATAPGPAPASAVAAPPTARPPLRHELTAALERREIAPSIAARIDRARAGGRPVEPPGGPSARLHEDAEADALAAELGARAFTTGRNVFVRRGELTPGLLAHELHHVRQQALGPPVSSLRIDRKDSAAEREAARAARGAVASVTPVPAGLVQRQAAPASMQPPNQTLLPDLTQIHWRAVQSDDAVLMLRGDDHALYVLPARGLVFEPLPEAPQAKAAQPASIGIPAAGHAATYLVRTGQGVGVLIDAAGTARGQPNVLMPASLAFIRARMGITNILGAVLSHTHADHIANLESFVQSGQVTGNRVFVYPGWESATAGPLARVFASLRAQRYAAQGFGPGWQPTQLTTRDVAGVTSATLQLGDARIDVVTRSVDLQRYVAELRAGRSGTKFADAASMLTRVRLAGFDFDLTIVGDIRGETLADLHDQMGAAAFNDFFKDTRVLGGFQHHLGAVNSARDVRGMLLLLRAARSAEVQLTAVVQTDAGRNMDLIRQLQEAGVRVIALGQVDPNAPAGVTIKATGAVEAQGAQTFDPTATALEAQSRIARLLRAAEVLEQHPTLISVSGAGHREIAQGLRAEAERLRGALYERQELALGQTWRSTTRADYATRLAQNTTSLTTPRGMAASVGDDGLRMLGRVAERGEEMEREVYLARQIGRASERLRRLVMEVEPEFARAVLADEFGRATTERETLRAQRRAETTLRRQAELQRIVGSSGGGGMGRMGKGVAVGLIALQLFEIVEPFITFEIQQYRDRKARDFYTFLTVGSWWQDKAVPMPLRARRGGADVPLGEMTPAALRRIWEDLPSNQQRPQKELPEAVQKSSPLQALWIPRLSEWPAPAQIWDAFRLWISIQVNTFDDYAAEFMDVPNPAIRQQGSFQTGTWEVLTGSIDSDGHVEEHWDASPELTKIMNATANTVIAGTEQRIEEAWKRRGAIEQQPSTMYDPNVPRAPIRQPLTRAHFRSGVGPVYSAIYIEAIHDWEIRKLDSFRFFDRNPYFQVHDAMGGPRGYVMVTGADYNTAAALRAGRTWHEDPARTVKIPKDVTPMYETLPRPPEYSAEEKAALAAAQAQQAVYYATPSSNVFRGEVHFPVLGPNVEGAVYVEASDLGEREL
jgi:hypothetical protein